MGSGASAEANKAAIGAASVDDLKAFLKDLPEEHRATLAASLAQAGSGGSTGKEGKPKVTIDQILEALSNCQEGKVLADSSPIEEMLASFDGACDDEQKKKSLLTKLAPTSELVGDLAEELKKLAPVLEKASQETEEMHKTISSSLAAVVEAADAPEVEDNLKEQLAEVEAKKKQLADQLADCQKKIERAEKLKVDILRACDTSSIA